VFQVTRAAIPVMREQGSGHIIQISSIGGRSGTPGLGAYQSAKWAVEGLSEVLKKEVESFGIRVTIVEPGGFRTDWAGSSMTVDTPRDVYQQSIGPLIEYRSSHLPIGDPEKAAQAILRIAGSEAPPLRLLLGRDAVAIAGQLAIARAAVDAACRELSLSTDADDADTSALRSLLDKLSLGSQKSA